MPELEIFHKPETGIFDEASYDKEGVITDFNSLPIDIEVSPTPTLRIHNIHPKSQILGDPKKKLSEAVYVSQPPACDPDHPKKGLQVKQNKAGIFISQDKYIAEILKQFDLVNVKTAITPMETKVALTKGEEAVTPKTSHLNAVKRIFKYLKGKPHLGLWYPRESPFDLEAYSDSDYGGSNLDRKSTTGGCQFLRQRLISWQCKKQTIVATSTTEAEYVAAANCCGQVLWVQNQLLDYGFNFMNTKIHIDNESTICIVKNPVYHSKTKHIEIRHHFIRDCYEKKLISVEKIHTDLNVADLLTKPFDGPRFNYLVPDESAGFAEIVDFLRGSNLMYPLSTNPTIYDSLVKQFWQTATANTIVDGTLKLHATIDTTEYIITEASIRDKLHLADASGITISKSGGWDQFGSNIATALICLSTGRVYNFSKLIFDGMVANLKSKTKFLMYPHFLQLILDIQTENKHPYLAVTLTKKIFGNMKRGFRGAPRPLLPAMLLVATTNPNAGQAHPDVAPSQPSSSTIPVPSTSLPPVQSPPPITTPIPETDPEPMEHTFEEPSPAHQHFSPPQEHAQEQMSVDDLLQLVPQLMTRVDSLEKDLKQTKLTMGSAIVKLVKKVKKLEGILKRKNVVFSDSEEEEPEDQGRKSQDDPLVSLVQGLVTPSKTTVNASGEEQVEDISPNTLEAAKTLSRVASQKPKSIDKGRRYKRRKETKGKKVVTSLDFQEEVSTGYAQEQILAVLNVSTRESSLAKAIRLDTLEKEEEAKQVHLDSLLAQRLAEEEELNEQQKQRRAQVQFEAQYYTDEDWDLIRARLKLMQSCQRLYKDSLKRFGEELQTKTSKRLKSDEAKDDVKQPVLKMSMRKSKARANQRDSVFVNFGAILHNISRDDLVDLYKIVLQKTTAYGPEEDLERAFAKNLRIMFDPPQSEDTVWSLSMHIPIVNWRYYDSCNVHCLNLHNTTAIYMLVERTYPLSEEVYRMMLKKKLFA
ncbi:hypothetical protein Tco_0538226 [Tanacetum coccineum]